MCYTDTKHIVKKGRGKTPYSSLAQSFDDFTQLPRVHFSGAHSGWGKDFPGPCQGLPENSEYGFKVTHYKPLGVRFRDGIEEHREQEWGLLPETIGKMQ